MLTTKLPTSGRPLLLQPDTARRLFALSLALFCVALGSNRFFYPAFCLCAALATLLVYHSPLSLVHAASTPDARSLPNSSHGFFNLSVRTTCLLLPLCLILYTALTPGHWLKDLPIAAKMLTAWGIGLAASQLDRPALATSLLFLPLTLALSVLFGGMVFPPEAGERLELAFSHPNVLGEVAAWSVLLVMTLYDTFSTKLKILAFACAVFCTAGMVMAVSRSAMLGLTVAMMVLVLTQFKKSAFIAFALCAVLATFACFLLPASKFVRLKTALEAPFADTTFQSRLPIWEAAWSGFLRAPLLGNGLRSFEADHGAYVREHHDTLVQKYGIVETRIGNPHQFPLGLLYMYGGIGTVLFGAVFLPGLLRAWRQKDALFLASVFFVLGHGLVECALHRKDGIFILLFPLGLSCGRALTAIVTVTEQMPQKLRDNTPEAEHPKRTP